MELSTTSTLALFETDKKQREAFARNIINEIKEGNADPLKVHMQVKSAEHLLEAVKDNDEYKELLLEAAQKHGKSFTMYNSDFQVKEAGTKWDYIECEDEVINGLYDELEELKARIKEREKFLQTIPESGIADPVTGSMIYRANKTSTTTVQVNLK